MIPWEVHPIDSTIFKERRTIMECIFTCPRCGYEELWDNEWDSTQPICPRCPVEERFDNHHDEVVELWEKQKEAKRANDLKRSAQYLLEILLLHPEPNQMAWKCLLHPERADLSGVPKELLEELPEVFSGSSTTEEREKRREFVRKIQMYATQSASEPVSYEVSSGNGEDSAPLIIERQFEGWTAFIVEELEQLCSTLPILPPSEAMKFFEEAGLATGKGIDAVEREGGKIFESLSGFVSSSDREDFSVTIDLTPRALTNGILMLETYDDAIGLLFFVARISDTSFITRGFMQSDKPSVVKLWNVKNGTVSSPIEEPQQDVKESVSESHSVEFEAPGSRQKPWWRFW
jgi:hypothetical protein